MAARTSGSKPSALPLLVLGAGAVFGAFRVVLASTESATGDVQLWGGVTVVLLLAMFLVARKRGADSSGAAARSARGQKRSEARAEKAAAKAAASEAKAARKPSKRGTASADRGAVPESAPERVSKRDARAAAKRADAEAAAAAKAGKREARAAAKTAQQDAKRRGGIDAGVPVRRSDPVAVPAEAPAAAPVNAPVVAPDARPAVFADLTSPDAVGAEQVAGLAQRALAAVAEQLAALDDRPLDAALISDLRRLAARVRRNGDALIVLAGGAPAPVRSGPTDLTISVTEAVASLDGAERVRVRPLDPAWVDAPVAAAIADVIAELTENALRCSGAEDPVEVFGRSERGGYALAVVDRGPGLAPDSRARINARLAGTGEGPSGVGIGFEVISRLAAAHDLRVELAPARGGGVAALVGVPAHRVIETRAIGKPEPAPIPVPPGVEVVSEAPSVEAASPAPVEAIPTVDRGPADVIAGVPGGTGAAAPPPVGPVDATAASPEESQWDVGDPTPTVPRGRTEEVLPPTPSEPAPTPSEPAPRPNLGLGSFADLHAASATPPPVTPGPPPVTPGPVATPPGPPPVVGPDATAPAAAGTEGAARWVVPEVSSDLLPGRGGGRPRPSAPRRDEDGPAAPAVSWGDTEEEERAAAESGTSSNAGEDRQDYFAAFRAAADRARENAGFDEN